MINDPIIRDALRVIKNIEKMCNERIKPRSPDSVWRAQKLFMELAKPYIDIMCDYLATRPKAAFQIPVFNYSGQLFPIVQVPD